MKVFLSSESVESLTKDVNSFHSVIHILLSTPVKRIKTLSAMLIFVFVWCRIDKGVFYFLFRYMFVLLSQSVKVPSIHD